MGGRLVGLPVPTEDRLAPHEVAPQEEDALEPRVTEPVERCTRGADRVLDVAGDLCAVGVDVLHEDHGADVSKNDGTTACLVTQRGAPRDVLLQAGAEAGPHG